MRKIQLQTSFCSIEGQNRNALITGKTDINDYGR